MQISLNWIKLIQSHSNFSKLNQTYQNWQLSNIAIQTVLSSSEDWRNFSLVSTRGQDMKWFIIEKLMILSIIYAMHLKTNPRTCKIQIQVEKLIFQIFQFFSNMIFQSILKFLSKNSLKGPIKCWKKKVIKMSSFGASIQKPLM